MYVLKRRRRTAKYLPGNSELPTRWLARLTRKRQTYSSGALWCAFRANRMETTCAFNNVPLSFRVWPAFHWQRSAAETTHARSAVRDHKRPAKTERLVCVHRPWNVPSQTDQYVVAWLCRLKRTGRVTR